MFVTMWSVQHKHACCLQLVKSCPVFLVWWTQCWNHPLPLTHASLHLFVSCMPCLGDLSHHTCCIVLSPTSCSPWQSVRGSHTQSSFLSWVPSSRFAASATESLCPLCLCSVLSWKFYSLFLNSVKFVAGLKRPCIKKTFIPHWQTIEDQVVEEGLRDRFPLFL